MSIRAIRWAIEQRVGSSTAKAVLIALGESADAGGQAYPSQQRIAEVTELGERTIRDALALLEQRGLIAREARYRKGGSRKSNLYRLSIPAAPAGMNPAPDAGMVLKPAAPAGIELTQPVARSAVTPESRIPAPDAGLVGSIPAGAAALVPTVLEPVTDTGSKDPAERSESDAQRLTNHVIEQGLSGERPDSYGRQAARAKQLLRQQPLDYWLEAADAMRGLFPYSDGTAWDVFDLGRLGAKALATAKNARASPNGNGRIYLRPEDLVGRVPEGPQAKTRMQVEHEERLRRRAAGGA